MSISKNHLIIFSVLCALISSLYLLHITPSDPISFPDNYVKASTESIWTAQFWMGQRPFVAILFYKICGSNPQRIILMQCIFSALCWSFLGYAASRWVKTTVLKPLVILAFAFVAVWWNVSGWYRALLTESFSMSVFALWLAVALLFDDRPKSMLGLFLVATALFIFGREAWSWFGMMAIFLFTVERMFFRKDRKAQGFYRLIMAASTLVFFISASQISQKAGRHHFSFLNVLTKRILVDPDHVTWFQENGAPLEEILSDSRGWPGKWATDLDGALLKDPRFKPFHYWVRDHGRSVYAKFLMTHPSYVLTSAWAAREEVYVWNIRGYHKNRPKSKILDLADLLFNPGRVLLYAFMLITWLVYACWKRLSLTPCILAICTGFNGLLTFHGDAMEVKRHCIMVALVYTVSAILSGFMGLDAITSYLQNRRKTSDENEGE